MPTPPIHLAILASGGGTTLQNLLDQIDAGRLNAKVSLVIASRPGVKAIDRAARAGIPAHVIDRKQFPSPLEFSQPIFRLIDEAKIELICLAGWLSMIEIPARYEGKIINIHPALLPSFGGKGMFGHHVHEAVIRHGCKLSGCTVHYVDAHYDNGPIILQRACPVLEDDTPEALAGRVFEEEKTAYPEAIRLFQQGRLRIDGRRVHVLPNSFQSST